MPVNRNALIRYRTIDNCLKNRQKRWTLEDLIDACSEALYEYEGIDKGVSRRSIQMDIQMMRSDKLGYNAPIIVLERKYYMYEDPEYSITNIPLTEQDLRKLTEVVEILRQFKGFSHFQELSGMVQRLENKIYSAKTRQEPVIDFEKNESLKGLEHIDTLYQEIIKKHAVELCYQSFKARSSSTFTFHPYYLKEYRNRWFVLGIKKKDTPIMTLALDRIISIQPSTIKYLPPTGFNVSDFFNDVIGVTVNQTEPPTRVVLFADNETAPYILTKPIHHSQQLLETLPNGIIFLLHVQLNYELEREILGFGDKLKIIEPERLKRRIKQILEHALDQYQHDFNGASLNAAIKKVEHKGFAILNHIYSKKEINLLRNVIYTHQKESIETEPYAIRNLLTKIPHLKNLIFNSNLITILKKIDRACFLTKAIFFDKSPDANWYVTWHQDTTIVVKERIDTEGFSGWTKKEGVYGVCPPDDTLKNTVTIRIHLDDTDEQNGVLKVIPGSHNKRLSTDEIHLITQNSIPYTCDVGACGIQIMKPLILHASAKATSQKHRRVFHLEFNSVELPNGLEWAERLEI
jgi:predicted DNA-binding transcriptional regulator YafY